MDVFDAHLVAHFDRSALVVVDTQTDFTDEGRSSIAGTTEIVPRLRELVDAFRSARRPVVHVVRLYHGEDVDLVRRTLVAAGDGPVAPGTPGSQLAGGLRLDDHPDLDHEHLLGGGIQELGPDEIVLWKPRWSAFFRTPLHAHLRESGVDTVVIAGCNFPNCPRATTFDASAHDYRIVLATDALSGITERHVEEMRAIGADAATTDEVRAALTTTPTR